MIEDLMALAKVSDPDRSMQPVPVDLAALVRETAGSPHAHGPPTTRARSSSWTWSSSPDGELRTPADGEQPAVQRPQVHPGRRPRPLGWPAGGRGAGRRPPHLRGHRHRDRCLELAARLHPLLPLPAWRLASGPAPDWGWRSSRTWSARTTAPSRSRRCWARAPRSPCGSRSPAPRRTVTGCPLTGSARRAGAGGPDCPRPSPPTPVPRTPAERRRAGRRAQRRRHPARGRHRPRQRPAALARHPCLPEDPATGYGQVVRPRR